MRKDNFDEDIKKLYMKHLTEMIVDEFLIYDKHFNIGKFSYSHIVNGSNDEMTLTDKEMEEVIKNSKDILKGEYGIVVITDNPITIEKIPSIS